MTNTRITDPEVLEQRYPVVLRQFSLRTGSGGAGKYRGGDGVVREIEFLKPGIQVGILSERRAFQPYGLEGGGNGERGKNLILMPDGRQINFGAKNSMTLTEAHTRVRILTPGGGGYGRQESS
jgi:5-oxoprolinase (ATP-hydrolysing)